MNEPRLEDWAEVCRGDEEAFAKLHRAYADGIYHVVTRILGNHEDASDALQETFLTAFRRRSTYRGEGSVRAWLAQIAVRIALRIRSRRRTGIPLDEEGVPTPEAAPEKASPHEFRAALDTEINRLPDRARTVFVLHTAEGLTHAEIAEVLGINEGTSKSQLSYARSLLRKRLSRFAHEAE